MDHDLIAAMYSNAEQPKSKPIEPHNLRSRKIRVGIVEYEVPAMEYVRHLEQLLAQQAHIIGQMQREMSRLTVSLNGTRSFIRRQTDAISTMHVPSQERE